MSWSMSSRQDHMYARRIQSLRENNKTSKGRKQMTRCIRSQLWKHAWDEGKKKHCAERDLKYRTKQLHVEKYNRRTFCDGARPARVVPQCPPVRNPWLYFLDCCGQERSANTIVESVRIRKLTTDPSWLWFDLNLTNRLLTPSSYCQSQSHVCIMKVRRLLTQEIGEVLIAFLYFSAFAIDVAVRDLWSRHHLCFVVSPRLVRDGCPSHWRKRRTDDRSCWSPKFDQLTNCAVSGHSCNGKTSQSKLRSD